MNPAISAWQNKDICHSEPPRLFRDQKILEYRDYGTNVRRCHGLNSLTRSAVCFLRRESLSLEPSNSPLAQVRFYNTMSWCLMTDASTRVLREAPDFTFFHLLSMNQCRSALILRDESRNDSTPNASLPFSLFLVFIKSSIRRSPNAISRRNSQSDFHGAMPDARFGATEQKRGERERAGMYAQSLWQSTRAAASWPTITELTPTLILHRLFTYHERTYGV